MEGLQRSSSTFRRSGSSGLVWDERFLTEGAEAQAAGEGGADDAQPEMRRSRSTGGVGMMLRRGGDDKKQQQQQQKKKEQQGQKKKDEERDPQVFRTKEVAPDVDPPSPRVSGCILCAIFGGSGSGSGSSPAARRGRAKPKRKQRPAA
ncbi:hypothetical protein CFC21_098804 [Triticum aestivum]|uniref:MAPK kinase substrate protein n=3 Tax=Triticum TaxID=4564 RepID=A0A9R0ZH40_TRITD|nr:MAPK kinase substrate protein At1g80180-like [Triticum aestivum]KAF7096924.1 hypothetical protein CFC21_098804 [Triticum aestivum]VAI77882.1 unnamed protein product [Triticum turgidum subsp. durum]